MTELTKIIKRNIDIPFNEHGIVLKENCKLNLDDLESEIFNYFEKIVDEEIEQHKRTITSDILSATNITIITIIGTLNIVKNKFRIKKEEETMGYFANSTESEFFKENNCYHCLNYSDTDFCPILVLHFWYSYKLCNSKSLAKKMLDFFVNTDGIEIGKWSCAMYKTNKI